ncbi:MAG: acyl-CoA dehydrogenase family protein [Reyranellaceae bacterium]
MKSQQPEALIESARKLTAKFAARAAGYDKDNAFPHEDFADLQAAGLLATSVPKEHGGHGVSMSNGDPLTQWRITAAVAAGDLSLGRCYEGHINTVDLINDFGSEALKREIFPQVVAGKMRFVIWGSEPIRQDTQDLYQRLSGQTVARRVEGGWVLNGAKAFATSAGGATHVIITAALEDASLSPLEQQQWFLADADTPGILIDKSWWHSLGMRATVSHKVDLKDVFVPERFRLFSTEQYLGRLWQARFIPHFSASFLGAATAAYEFACDYLRQRRKADDPVLQNHIGQARVALDLLDAHLVATAQLWNSGDRDAAALRCNMCRAAGEQLAMEAVGRAIRVSGATALLEQYPLGRIMRDLQTYVRHESIDRILTAIGKGCLGMDYDPNFARSNHTAIQVAAGARAQRAQ